MIFRAISLIFKPFLLKKHNVTKLGSSYGGWFVKNCSGLSKSVLVSCGGGEDFSFDIEFLNRFESKVFIIDPTPNSHKHFLEIILSQKKHATTTYSKDGKQLITSYDTTRITNNNFFFIKKAMSNKNASARFYKPKNPNHISHTLFQGYHTSEDYIVVETLTLSRFLNQFNIDRIGVLKLDIEGAEVYVLEECIQKKICPDQILVEFDFIKKLSVAKLLLFIRLLRSLRKLEYELFIMEDYNFSFINTRSKP